MTRRATAFTRLGFVAGGMPPRVTKSLITMGFVVRSCFRAQTPSLARWERPSAPDSTPKPLMVQIIFWPEHVHTTGGWPSSVRTVPNVDAV